MASLMQLFVLIAASLQSVQAGCLDCTPGHLSNGVGRCYDHDGCCDSCQNYDGGYCDECVGYTYTTLAGTDSFFIGCGSVTGGRSSGLTCPKLQDKTDLQSNATSPNIVYGSITFWNSAFLPVVLDSGFLEGKHKTLKLNRKGRCAGDLKVRLLGETMLHKNRKATVEVEDVGVCCDLCTEMPGCVGWSLDDWECSLLRSTDGKREKCESCFSGLDVVYSSTREALSRPLVAKSPTVQPTVADGSTSGRCWVCPCGGMGCGETCTSHSGSWCSNGEFYDGPDCNRYCQSSVVNISSKADTNEVDDSPNTINRKFLIGLGGAFLLVFQVLVGIFVMTSLFRVENPEMQNALKKAGVVTA